MGWPVPFAILLLTSLCCKSDDDSRDTEADTDTDSDSDTDTDSDSAGDARFEVTWSVSGVTVAVIDGTGTYELGIAETGALPGGWFGEDCIQLPEDAGFYFCHPMTATGVALLSVNNTWEIASGSTTLFHDTQSSNLTYAVWDEQDACVTWGQGPSWFTDVGCVEITR